MACVKMAAASHRHAVCSVCSAHQSRSIAGASTRHQVRVVRRNFQHAAAAGQAGSQLWEAAAVVDFSSSLSSTCAFQNTALLESCTQRACPRPQLLPTGNSRPLLHSSHGCSAVKSSSPDPPGAPTMGTRDSPCSSAPLSLESNGRENYSNTSRETRVGWQAPRRP